MRDTELLNNDLKNILTAITSAGYQTRHQTWYSHNLPHNIFDNTKNILLPLLNTAGHTSMT